MKKLSEYFNDYKEQNVNESNLGIIGSTAEKLLIFVAGIFYADIPGMVYFMAIGAAVLFPLIWEIVRIQQNEEDELNTKNQSTKESLEDNQEMMTESLQDMIKPAVMKIIKNPVIKRFINDIESLDGYQEIKKNRDLKGIYNLVKEYFEKNKEQLKEVNNALKQIKL